MLKSLLSSSLRSAFSFNATHLIQRQAFAEGVTKTKIIVKRRVPIQKKPEPKVEDPNVWIDPKLEGLSKYVEKLDFETSKRIYKNCDFEKDMLPALNLYQKLEFNAKQLKFLFKRKPTALRLARPVDKNDIVQLSELVEKKWGLNKHQIRSLVLRDPWILNKSNEELVDQVQHLQGKLQMTDKEVKRLLIIYPTVFELSKDAMDLKIQTITDYTEIPARTLGIIAARYPFLLATPQETLLGTLKVLHEKKFTGPQIVKIIKKHAEVLTVVPITLKHTFRLPERMRMRPHQIAKIYTDNPRLMTVCPYNFMPRKWRIIRTQARRAKKSVAGMLMRYPRIFIKSMGSTFLKINYLKHKFRVRRMRKNHAFPMIMNYSYAGIIRPRGEMMVRQRKKLEWVDVLQMTDQEFVDKMGRTMEDLNTIKSEFSEINNELDYKIRFFSKYFSNRGSRAHY